MSPEDAEAYIWYSATGFDLESVQIREGIKYGTAYLTFAEQSDADAFLAMFHLILDLDYAADDGAEAPPKRERKKRGPTGGVSAKHSEEEQFIDKIIAERPRGRGKQYLVRFAGGSERWLPGREIANCTALGRWLERPEE
ncbi:hypothetical protein DFH08DRAFT_886800 [Mycena albidolilacea]|uniref:Chromo domain-containing protein n=1 Tax=Mycena albidolilacea TaxID=1033008 RepID=A0AAD7EIN2_9AGAR|nr:hypothetical protein DFH08DRAFT_886800 [Mycena albidolilacea]